MAIELSGLAARLRAGIDKAAAERDEELRLAAEVRARRDAARVETLQAQHEMLAALVAFADQVGGFTVSRGALMVELVLDGRGLRLAAVRSDEDPTDHILVEAATGTERSFATGHHLTRDELGEWDVVLAEEHGPRRLPVELGLEELFGQVLGLAPDIPAAAPPPVSALPPVPEAEPEPPRSPGKRRGRALAAPPGSGLRPLKRPFG